MEVGGRRPRDGARHAGMEPGQALSFDYGMEFQKTFIFLNPNSSTYYPAALMIILYWTKFYPANILSHVNDYIAPMAIFTERVKNIL